MIFLHTDEQTNKLKKCRVGCYLAPKPASGARPGRFPTFHLWPSLQEGVPTGRSNASIWVGEGPTSTAGRAAGERPRFTSRCSRTLTYLTPSWNEGGVFVVPQDGGA